MSIITPPPELKKYPTIAADLAANEAPTVLLSEEKQKAINWLRFIYRGEFSELGGNVALFLDKMWGLHNINRTSLGKVDFGNNTWVEIVTDKFFATVDSDDLTRLVVISHQMMLRVELRGVGPGYVRLMFHQRTSRNREDGFYRWCPTIQDHVEAIAKHHPAVQP